MENSNNIFEQYVRKILENGLQERVEKFKEEDTEVMALMEARNSFENYVYQTKQTIEDQNLKSQLGDNYENIKEKLDEASKILDVENVSKEEFKTVQDQLENYINPIMQEIMQKQGGSMPSGMPGDMPDKSTSEVPQEPPIEEID